MVDLTTGQTLFSARADTGRLPASVEKLYTTSTVLLRFGPNANLLTRVLGVGTISDGVFTGTLYLRGGGDPTFGAQGFDRYYYGTGATMQRLVANLIRDTGLTAVDGRIAGDESYFDSLRGTIATDFESSEYVEGQLVRARLRPRLHEHLRDRVPTPPGGSSPRSSSPPRYGRAA